MRSALTPSCWIYLLFWLDNFFSVYNISIRAYVSVSVYFGRVHALYDTIRSLR